MPKIIKGPITIAQIANLVESGYRAFLKKNNSYVNTKLDFWQPQMIIFPSKYITKNMNHLYDLYNLVGNRNYRNQLEKYSKEFAVDIKSCNNRNYLTSVTRIFNKTLLEDMVTGQTFPAPKKEFVIESYNIRWNNNFFNNWVEYRNMLIDQAQARVNGSVSKAALHLLDDLR